MKKLTILIIIFLIFLTFSCKNKSETLNVGIYSDYPPFSYKEDGNFKGFNIDFLDLCLKRLNYTPNYVEVDFDSFDKLKKGEVDILIGAYPILYEYPEGISLTEPYFDLSIYLISRVDNPIEKVEDLTDKKLILPLYTFSEELVKNVKNLEKIPYKNFKDSINKLENREVDAILIEKVIAEMYKIDEEKFVKVNFYNQGLTIVLKQEDDELRYKLNEAIRTIVKSKNYNNLILKWFEEEK